MRNTEFQALSTYTTQAEVDQLADGTKFFWGAAGTRLTPNIHGRQKGNTALRHRITYYVKGTDHDGNAVTRVAYDLLESDIGTKLTKSQNKKNKTVLPARDDDDRRDIIFSGDWA
jgi:hypothetical protein